MIWLERAPLWATGLVVLVALIAAEQLGFTARRIAIRAGRVESSDDGLGHLLSAALALLGLLVAFTFGSASDRYDVRRHLVVEEANAIDSTYLRIQVLDDGPKTALSALMTQYIRARQAFFQAGENAALLEQSEARTAALKDRIWAATTAAVRASPAASINPSLLQTTNDMFDLAASRRAAMDDRIPATVARMLLIYALISAVIIGYSMGHGRRHLVVTAALFLALSLAICLILDIDRPRAGTIRVSQAAMAREAASIDALEAAKAATRAPQVSFP